MAGAQSLPAVAPVPFVFPWSDAPAAAGRSLPAPQSLPSSTAVVTVAAPIVHKTSFNSLKRFDVMAKFLHQRLAQSKWLEEYHENMYFGTANLGTFVRRTDGTYARTTQNAGVLEAVELLAPAVAFTMSCDPVSVLLDGLTADETSVDFMDGSALLVIPSVTDIKHNEALARTGGGSILCRREHFILVCATSPPELLAQAAALESHLVAMIWGGPIIAPPAATYAPMDFDHVRSSSVPTLPRELSTLSFGEQPDLHLPQMTLPRHNSVVDPLQRRAIMAQHPVRPTVPLAPLTVPQRFDDRFSAEENPISPTRAAFPQQPPSPKRRPNTAGPGRRMSVTPQRSVPNKPRVSFNEPEYATATPRSRSIDASRRPSFAPVANHGRAYSRASFDSVPEDIVPPMTAFPPRKASMMPRNMSVSSTYLGQYRGSMSMDIATKLEIVERAMEVEEQGEPDVVMQRDQKRPFMLTHSCLVAVAAGLVVTLDIWCAAKLISESRLDGNYYRWVLLVTVPFFSIFSLFFMIVISGSFFQLFGPLGFLQQNSRYYSAKAPKLSEHAGEELPHITIQMPVYKEGLKGVIVPTITSVIKAVNYYQAHGGSATILVCDDGMQLISEELQEARKVFYDLHNVAWVARPKQNTTPGPDFFLRKGKFKKASNMNYALDFSLRVEEEWSKRLEILAKQHGCSVDDLTVEDEDEVYEAARQRIEEQDGGRTWSAGDVRIGEFILIIDSDTLVPENCLLCGALEMMESPDVAIIQHSSGVMNQTGNTFENGITYFTELIYTSITHAVGGGDVAPFVGHNAFLRWRAIQSIAFQEDDRTKFWSESHVSEDFEVSLRLQQEGFVVRMAGYHHNEFKEGVSLTVYDELARWEKYAYGCNELLFHPLIYWPIRGPFTPLFIKFLRSNIKITSKFTIIAYIGTYYAIAVGFPLSIVNFLIAGWQFELDHYYQTSWKIFVGLCVVYNILSPVSFAMLRYRMGQCSYIAALGDCIKWTPLFMLFFGGLSYHLCKALLCHFFSVQIEWTTTAKELEKTGFKIGLDRVFRDFWKMYLIMFPLLGGMIYLGCYAPRGWRITDFTVIVPLANQIGCHALLPFALGLF